MPSDFNPNFPFELPTLPPPISEADLYSPDIVDQMYKTIKELAELDAACDSISNPFLLLQIPIFQESSASLEIEGIHTTVESALEAQVKPEQEQDPITKESLNYRAALRAGYTLVKQYSLSTRTIREVHSKLLVDGGRYRTQQNHIRKGNEVIYTPPATTSVESLMGNWETFVHENQTINPIIKTAISHYQFEAIHPFSDGNGRAGRILVVLQLVLDDVLTFPVLYISGYLNRYRTEYYEALLSVSRDKNWLRFIMFMLKAMQEQALVTRLVILKIVIAQDETKEKIKTRFKNIYSEELVNHIFEYPVTSPVFMADKIGITYQTASRHLKALESGGFLSSRKSGRHNYFYNMKLLDCLKT